MLVSSEHVVCMGCPAGILCFGFVFVFLFLEEGILQKGIRNLVCVNICIMFLCSLNVLLMHNKEGNVGL